MPQDRSNELELVLHIGGAKCGSSAIQAFLRQNAKELRARGVAIPGEALNFKSPVSGQQIWAFEKAASDGDADALAARLTQLIDEAHAQGYRQLILSAENICNHPDLAPIIAQAGGNHPVKVVFYVRRQDDFLISGWQQWHLKTFDSVAAYLSDRVGRVACWHSMIVPWADLLGDDRIVVRPFVRKRLKDQDVVADFCDVVGIDLNGLALLQRNANPSFDDALARLAHRVRDVFEDQHDNRFYEVMVRLLGKDALKSQSASSLLDLETRHRILLRYAEENEALRDRFLPELGQAPLFAPPVAGDVTIASDVEKLSDEMAMLTRSVYALAQKLDKAS